MMQLYETCTCTYLQEVQSQPMSSWRAGKMEGGTDRLVHAHLFCLCLPSPQEHVKLLCVCVVFFFLLNILYILKRKKKWHSTIKAPVMHQ